MGYVTLTIAEIKRPAEGKDRGNIIGTNGTKLGCFREKLSQFQLGSTYEIEITDGDYKNVKSAKQVASPQPAQAHQPAPTSQPNGSGNGHYPQPAAFSTPEQIFCRDLIVAYIGNGRCPPEKLTETINYIRVAWNRTFGGNDGTFFANEAGQRHHLQAAE